MSATPAPLSSPPWSLMKPPSTRAQWLDEREHHHVMDKHGNFTQYTCIGGSKLVIVAGYGIVTVGTLRKQMEGERPESQPPAAFVEHGLHHEQYALAAYTEYMRRKHDDELLVIGGDKTVRYHCSRYRDLKLTPQFVATPDGFVVNSATGEKDRIFEIKCPAMRTPDDIDSWRGVYPFGIHPNYLPQLALYMEAYDMDRGEFVFFFAHTPAMRRLCALRMHEFMEALRDDETYRVVLSNMRILPYVRCEAFWRFLCEKTSHFYSCLINHESLGKQPSKKATLAHVTGLLRLHEIEVVGRETEAAPRGQTEPAVEQELEMNTYS